MRECVAYRVPSGKKRRTGGRREDVRSLMHGSRCSRYYLYEIGVAVEREGMLEGWFMSPPMLSSKPVVIPLSAVPSNCRPTEGGGRLTINASEAVSRRSAVLSLLWFCITSCEGNGVSIEAWVPWDGVTSHAPSQGPHSYLTSEALSLLSEPDQVGAIIFLDAT
jgi:hypothetical protein